MYWKKVKPFILELLIFICLIVIVSFAISNPLIINKYPILKFLFLIWGIIWLLQYICTSISFSLLVSIDFIFCQYRMEEIQYVDEFMYKSSVLLLKNVEDSKELIYYKIYGVDSTEKVRVFTTANYYNLTPKEKYIFVYGKNSKVLIDIK